MELGHQVLLAITEHILMYMPILVVVVGQVAHQEVELYFHLVLVGYTAVTVASMVAEVAVAIYILGIAILLQDAVLMVQFVLCGAVAERIQVQTLVIHIHQ
jgi:hypothetical protein